MMESSDVFTTAIIAMQIQEQNRFLSIMLDLSENTKEKLKQWGFLRDRKDYQFFYKIENYTFDKKLEEFGRNHIDDVLLLIKEKEESKILRRIRRIKGNKNRILLADTYFNIRKGYQRIMRDCQYRLIEDYCSMAGENCAPYICPIVISELTGHKK